MDPTSELATLLSREASWAPDPGEAARWAPRARAADAPEPLRQEARWWEALEAGRAGDWARVSALAEAGLAPAFSAREALRLAYLHCLSGSVEEAEHVVSQAVQLHGDAALARALADWCERDGLLAAAARLRAGAAGPAR